MTSPTQPPSESLVSRVTARFGGGSNTDDPEERFTRNVTYAFIGLIVIVAIVIVFALIYGVWDANFRPVATVGSAEISRTQFEERLRLEDFRLRREEGQLRTALAAGTIEPTVANARIALVGQERAALGLGEATLDRLVDLTLQRQLAEEAGVVPSQAELDLAVADSGSTGELRRVQAIVVLPEGLEIGVAPNGKSRQEALAKAQAAKAALDAGRPFDEVAAEYSSAAAEGFSGDLGFLERDDISDPVWADAIFDLEIGEITDIVTGDAGEYIVGTIDAITPPQPDPGFLVAVAAEEGVGEQVNRDNVELETIAAALEAKVIADAVAGDVEQVQLAEIFIEGDTFVDEDDEGTVRASHILFQPDGVGTADEPAEDDPAWTEKELLAQRAADQLRAVEDPDLRAEAFVKRAARQSDGPTSVTGGDLGYFSRAGMVPEFASPLFDTPDLQAGDIIGPVRSQFGWHVIQFTDRRAPIMERLEAVEAALAAADADFASVAEQFSDGAEAIDGGATGWHISDDLDDVALVALSQIDVGAITEPVDGGDGYYIYEKLDQGARPLDAAQAALIADEAFFEWFTQRRFDAEDAGEISIDRSLFVVPAPRGPVNAPAGGHG